MVTNLPNFSSPALIVHQFAKVFSRQSFVLYGMTLTVNKIDGHGLINTEHCEHLQKTNMTWYWLQKNYPKDREL